MNNESLGSNEIDPALEMLKSEALSLNGLALADGRDLSGLEIAPGTYSENQGVIIFAIGDQKYAMPSSDRTKEFIKIAELREVAAGVPHLNDADAWGSPERRNQMSSFSSWQKLSQRQ